MFTIGVIIGGICALLELVRIFGGPRPPSNPLPNTAYMPAFGASSGYTKSRPNTLYHGTSLQNAFEIYNSGMWMVGNSSPPAVWMGESFTTAKAYAGSNGGIVVIGVDPQVNLTSRGAGVFIYEIPDARPKEEYFQIPGLRPVGVLDVNGNRLA